MEIKENILGIHSSDADLIFINFKHSIADHGNEIDEIISSKPPFLIRWGTIFFFFVVLLTGFIAWVIRYPDIVTANGTLTCINAPKEVIVKADGKLKGLFVREEQIVHKGEVIGYIETTAAHEDVIELSVKLDSVSNSIQHDSINQILNFSTATFRDLGELQNPYQIFIQAFQQFTSYIANGYYTQKRHILKEDIDYLQRVHSTLLEQKSIFYRNLLMTDTTLKVDKILKNKRIISRIEYQNEKRKILQKKMTLPQISPSIITNENQQHEKLKEISELENNIQQQKTIFIQALNIFKCVVDEWRRKYLLTAPIEGKVAFSSFLQEGQQLKAGQIICYVNSGNTDYYFEARIPQYNFGKVKTGQFVNLKFLAYPFQEFGKVKGRIEIINSVPSDSGYLAKISLPEGLVTNYKKQLQYKTGLSAQADIIISKKRLLKRLLESLVK